MMPSVNSTRLGFGSLATAMRVAWILAVGVSGCRQNQTEPARLPTAAPSPVRPVRVLLSKTASHLRLRSESLVSVRSEKERFSASPDSSGWIDVSVHAPGSIKIGDTIVDSADVTLTSDRDGPLRLSIPSSDGTPLDHVYYGSIRASINDSGRFSVLNLVDLEPYVAGVVAGEVWPTFDTEAYRAQAIAARTFILYRMKKRSHLAYDVTSTEGAQVYRGVRTDDTGLRAARAAGYSRGIVCGFVDGGEDRLFSTFYCSACGGLTQSAVIFGAANDVAPLRGGVVCNYCKIAPGDSYRWGPVRIPITEVLDRLVARYPDLKSLEKIEAISISKRTTRGRPLRISIQGEKGESHEMLAERFRLAMGSMVVRSTDFDIRIADGDVVFEHGRGFGHGIGLCQWGMQAQALQGKTAGAILRYYYPESKLIRVY